MSTKPTYRVARVAPAEVRADLSRLWRANLATVGSVEHKFNWLYRNAPDRAGSVFMLAADDEEASRWVGTAGVLVRRIAVGGRELRGGLLADLAVDKDHRTVMPALALVRGTRQWVFGEGRFDLAYGFPNQHAQGVFQRAGYTPLGTLRRWARVLRHASYAPRLKSLGLPRIPPLVRRVLDRAVDSPALTGFVGAAIDAVQLARTTPAAARALVEVRLDWLPEADGRIDEVWERARDAYGVVAVRSARFLRWRYPGLERDDQPGWIEYGYATRRDSGAAVAYIVVEHSEGGAFVHDLFGTHEGVGALLDQLLHVAYARGAALVSMRYLGAPWLSEALEARGWSPRESLRMITIGVGDHVEPALRETLTTAARWHLTDADEDA
jgi:hypothetical protein